MMSGDEDVRLDDPSVNNLILECYGSRTEES